MNFLQNKYSKLPKKSMEYLRLKKKIMEEKNRLNKSNNIFYHPLKIKTIPNNINIQNKKEVIVEKNDKSTEFNFENFKEPLISFIVPVYNCVRYISRCLNSILNQTVKNIEIIVVNDGSTDGVESILNSYSERFKNIKIINQENMGLSGARNTGIKNANGLYLSFIDSDDYIFPQTSEFIINKCLKYNLDACFFDFQARDILTNLNLNSAYSISSHLDEYNIEKVTHPLKLNWSILNNSVCCGFYRRDIFIKNDAYFNTEIKFAEDCIWKFKYLLLFENIMFVNRKFYIYYKNRCNSLTTNLNINNILDYFNELLCLYYDYEKDENLLQKYIDIFVREITYYTKITNSMILKKWCLDKIDKLDKNILSKSIYFNRLENLKI